MSLFRRKGRSAAAVVAIVGVVSLYGATPATSVTGLGAPTLDPLSDSGELNNDRVTNSPSLSFLAVGTLAAGEKWQLVEDDVAVGTPTSTSPVVYGSVGTPSPAGVHVYKMRVVDSLNANATVDESTGITVTVDRMAPTATAGAPDLEAAGDSGASATDNITKSTARSFAVAVTGGPIAGDEKLQLLRTGTPVVSAATSPLADTAAVDGSYLYTARVVDLAGNASAASAATTVVVDTVALPPGIALTTASDTGRSSSDGITTTLNQVTGLHTTTLGFNFTGETGAVLSSWTRKIGAAAAVARTFASAATTQAMPAGTATATDAVGVLATIAPTNGSYLYTVAQTDLAGNASTPGSTTVVVDTVAPAPAVVTLDASTDSGPSSSDGITRWDAAAAAGNLTALKINVTGEVAARVELRRNGAVVAAPSTPFDIPMPAVPGPIGMGQITDPGPFPFTAVHGYTADLVDVAGNISNGAQGFTVDLDNPTLPSKPDLLTTSDLGTSDGDDITSDNTPTLRISGAEETATQFVYRCPGASACSVANRILVGTRVGNGDVELPVTPDNSAAITSWRFAVGQRDLAGRLSGGTAAGLPLGVFEPAALSVHINIVIDTVPEPVPASPTLTPGSQTGLGAGADRTGSVSPTFNVSKGTGRVQLLRNGTVVGTSVGAGDITDAGPLANGTYTYTSRSVDAAGNPSAASAPLVVTIANAGGYWLLGGDGGVFSFGNAPFFGSTGDMTLNAPVMAMAPTPNRDGYWLLARDGGVFSFGNAGFFGSTGDQVLNSPVVGMVASPTGKGYWLFAADGGVFAFGDAPFHGSAAGTATSPIVAMLATKDGLGYWLVDAKGKVFAFGLADPITGVESLALNSPIVGFTLTPSGRGLWLVAADGGVFALGDAVFEGSAGSLVLNKPIIGMLAPPAGGGYLLFASDGGVFTYGSAEFLGSTGDKTLNAPIVGLAAT